MSRDTKNVIIATLLTLILSMIQPGTVLIENANEMQYTTFYAFEFIAIIAILHQIDSMIIRVNVVRKRKRIRPKRRETILTHYDISNTMAEKEKEAI